MAVEGKEILYNKTIAPHLPNWMITFFSCDATGKKTMEKVLSLEFCNPLWSPRVKEISLFYNLIN